MEQQINHKALLSSPREISFLAQSLTFYRSSTFTVDVIYADAGGLQVPPKISTYTIGPFQSTKDERAKLKVKVKLNLHGIVAIESATLMEEEVEAPVMKEPMKMGTDETPSEVAPVETGEHDVSMEDSKSVGDASGVENGAAEFGDKPVQMETDAKVEAPKRKGHGRNKRQATADCSSGRSSEGCREDRVEQKEWRITRSEWGFDEDDSYNCSSCPVRGCVDEHVSCIYRSFYPLFSQFIDKRLANSDISTILDGGTDRWFWFEKVVTVVLIDGSVGLMDAWAC
ncbi:hypothetical protein IFM89_017939 [Coptis chinensis]|uniref:Uncharacterized protein n=1 Tax=Coptis chinensis TaxID=261450 RepID=A0A835HTR6_9MAGN|nr:hypothetical protein IFM89_017939 [Coptis chinensis]